VFKGAPASSSASTLAASPSLTAANNSASLSGSSAATAVVDINTITEHFQSTAGLALAGKLEMYNRSSVISASPMMRVDLTREIDYR